MAWTLDEVSKDLVQQAIAAEMPIYLIDSEEGTPRRIRAGDERMG